MVTLFFFPSLWININIFTFKNWQTDKIIEKQNMYF